MSTNDDDYIYVSQFNVVNIILDPTMKTVEQLNNGSLYNNEQYDVIFDIDYFLRDIMNSYQNKLGIMRQFTC